MSGSTRMPCVYIPHGGGPCFFMDPPPPMPRDTWDGLAAYLRQTGAALAPRPSSILVISGHWETIVPTVSSATVHSLLYDYYGFPEHTYRLRYPAKGSPLLASRVRSLLAADSIASAEDSERGLDHGVFVPFLLMFPEADIPIVQLSLRVDMDPAEHLAIGRTLAPLRDDGVLIVGSGMSYHNMQGMFAGERANRDSDLFDGWLTDAVAEADPAVRAARLTSWVEAPAARTCHPRPEHLLPLHVVAGAAAGDPGRQTYSQRIFGKSVSGYHFG